MAFKTASNLSNLLSYQALKLLFLSPQVKSWLPCRAFGLICVWSIWFLWGLVSVSVFESECTCLPGPILCATIDVGAIIQQVLNYAEPATGARFVKSTVTRVVSVIHLTYSVLQTVQHHLLRRNRRRAGFRLGNCVCVFLLPNQRKTSPSARVRRSRRTRRQSFPLLFLWGEELGKGRN